jgi:hypothetical protein
MKVPLEISFRGIEKIDAVEDLIRDKAADMERLCDDIISCRIVVEVPQQYQKRGGTGGMGHPDHFVLGPGARLGDRDHIPLPAVRRSI